jgi:hypothetical protein
MLSCRYFYGIGTTLITVLKKRQQFMRSYDNNYKILLFHSSICFDTWPYGNLTLVNSPASCLKKATENNYNLIAIFHEYRSFKERHAIVELCSMLKINQYTLHIPIIALLTSKHRELLEQLHEAGVKYARFYDPSDPNLKNHIKTLLVNPPEECKISRIMSGICPHINYFPISGHREILYCSAYRNRLVLDSYRLRHLCETSNHKNCQYFNCPKFF